MKQNTLKKWNQLAVVAAVLWFGGVAFLFLESARQPGWEWDFVTLDALGFAAIWSMWFSVRVFVRG
jgi:hypothetical protein